MESKIKNIAILGSSGMLGRAMCRVKPDNKQTFNTLTDHVWGTGERRVDLLEYTPTLEFLKEYTLDTVFMCAGKVGGIQDNKDNHFSYMAENLAMGSNVVRACVELDLQLVYFGSSCMYSPSLEQPFKIEDVHKGQVEETNKGYALAKRAVAKMIEIHHHKMMTIIPPNLYGPGDNYAEGSSHVMAALIRKFVEAERFGDPDVYIWGDGTQRREFMHVDDLAKAAFKTAEDRFNLLYPLIYPYNIGVNFDVSIMDLALMISEIVGYEGNIKTMDGPVGMESKLMRSITNSDVRSLRDGIAQTIAELE